MSVLFINVKTAVYKNVNDDIVGHTGKTAKIKNVILLNNTVTLATCCWVISPFMIYKISYLEKLRLLMSFYSKFIEVCADNCVNIKAFNEVIAKIKRCSFFNSVPRCMS